MKLYFFPVSQKSAMLAAGQGLDNIGWAKFLHNNKMAARYVHFISIHDNNNNDNKQKDEPVCSDRWASLPGASLLEKGKPVCLISKSQFA